MNDPVSPANTIPDDDNELSLEDLKELLVDLKKLLAKIKAELDEQA